MPALYPFPFVGEREGGVPEFRDINVTIYPGNKATAQGARYARTPCKKENQIKSIELF